MTNDLFLAILAMDAYNRGYNPGIADLSDTVGTQIGTATISNRSSFYTVAYAWNGDTIMASRRRRPWRGP
ncbi:MAG: hypothetical protein H6749_00145 [Nitrospiraceae bacterium]|nr:hypothetical protein [Nitrospiraceae bacterium]